VARAERALFSRLPQFRWNVVRVQKLSPHLTASFTLLAMVLPVNALAVRLTGRLRLEAMEKVQRSGLDVRGVSTPAWRG